MFRYQAGENLYGTGFTPPAQPTKKQAGPFPELAFAYPAIANGRLYMLASAPRTNQGEQLQVLVDHELDLQSFVGRKRHKPEHPTLARALLSLPNLSK